MIAAVQQFDHTQVIDWSADTLQSKELLDFFDRKQSNDNF